MAHSWTSKYTHIYIRGYKCAQINNNSYQNDQNLSKPASDNEWIWWIQCNVDRAQEN